MNDLDRGSLPWSFAEVRTASVTVAIGAVLLAWSWWQASGTANMNSEVGWLAVAVFATVVASAGAFNWFWAGRRAVSMRRTKVIDTVAADLLAGSTTTIELDTDPTSIPVGLAGSDRYHRDDCLLVRDKPVQQLALTEGRQACEMCRP